MFDWDDDNTDHIARHGLEPEEVEEAINDRARVRAPAHSGRSGFIGRTDDGRLLVVIVERSGRLLRVVTVRDASPAEKRTYRRQNR